MRGDAQIVFEESVARAYAFVYVSFGFAPSDLALFGSCTIFADGNEKKNEYYLQNENQCNSAGSYRSAKLRAATACLGAVDLPSLRFIQSTKIQCMSCKLQQNMTSSFQVMGSFLIQIRK